MPLVLKVVIKGGFAYVRSSTYIVRGGRAVAFFKKELHRNIENVILLQALFLHTFLCSNLLGIELVYTYR